MKGLKEEDDLKDTPKEEEKKEKDYPQENIESILKSIGMAQCIPKLKEAEINDPEIFFELSEDTVITCLGIETEGKKYRFKEKIKEVKEKHEKIKAKREQQLMNDTTGETFEKIQKKLTVIF